MRGYQETKSLESSALATCRAERSGRPNGRSLTVVAKNLSERNLHVRSVTLNGRPLKGFILKHELMLAGGELVFEMCP